MRKELHLRQIAKTMRNLRLSVLRRIITMKVPLIRPSWTIEPYWPNWRSLKPRSCLILLEEEETTPPSEQLKSWMNQKMTKIMKRMPRDKRILFPKSFAFCTSFSLFIVYYEMKIG